MILRVLDFETLGLPPDNCQIVEAATVDLIGHDTGDGQMEWTRGRMWRSFVNPKLPIPPEVSAIHHITDEMVADAPSIEELKSTIFFGGSEHSSKPPVDHFAAHNAKFEIACAPWLPVPVLCTYKCAIAAWPEAPSFSNQALRYWLDLKLADDVGPPHRALGDAYVTAAILRRLLSLGNTIEDMLKVSTMPSLLPRLTFGEHAMKPAAEVPESYWSWIVNKSKGPWDPDVLHTANHYLALRRGESRSPV